ncbi:hypothetical protein ACFFX0_20300 [Citricoccus parietis]|uniref:Secreted protein n=1 Tax=Citricoccus parietis TaxID=592307 RepID=A0ABV5G3A0_9MICC
MRAPPAIPIRASTGAVRRAPWPLQPLKWLSWWVLSMVLGDAPASATSPPSRSSSGQRQCRGDVVWTAFGQLGRCDPRHDCSFHCSKSGARSTP